MSDQTQHTKNQHWIPKFYLKGFIDPTISSKKPQFWVFNTKEALTNKSYTPNKQTPKKFANNYYFYEVSGMPLNAVEDTLQVIEDKFAKIFKEKIENRIELTKEEHNWVSYFIATLESRTAASKEHIEGFYDEVMEHFKQLEGVNNDGKVTPTHKAWKKMKESNYGFTQMIAVSVEVNRWRFSDFQFLYIGEDSDYSFISGNQPSCLYDMTYMNSLYGIDPLSPTFEVTIPLSPKIALFINNAGITGYRDLTHHLNYIEEVNNRTIANNGSFLIANTKFDYKYLERVVRRQRQSLILLNQRESISKEFHRKRKGSLRNRILRFLSQFFMKSN